MSVESSASSSEGTPLQFQAFNSAVDVSFWHQLGSNKLEKYQLNDERIPIVGAFTNTSNPAVASSMLLGGEYSFEASPSSSTSFPHLHSLATGYLHNKNTFEEFKNINTSALINAVRDEIMSNIHSGKATHFPNLLSPFFVITFADLKQHKYYYWFCFPALFQEKWTPILRSSPQLLDERLVEPHHFLQSFESFTGTQNQDNTSHSQLTRPLPPYFLIYLKDKTSVSFHTLSEYDSLKKESDASSGRVYFGFLDSCGLPSNPGWTLRNLLVYLSVHLRIRQASIISYRDVFTSTSSSTLHSVLFDVSLPVWNESVDGIIQCVGYEKNKSGKTLPRVLDLGMIMEPSRLCETSVDLNLKLMRWRLLPSLDLAIIQQSKCLLLGAGTLGCNVSRALLGWGCKHITFIDNSRVSYSNPVRQSLFNFQDCLNGGKLKAQAAADAIKAIYPNAITRGVHMTIPMAGHAISPSEIESTVGAINQLSELIDEHDIIFLLTDSRESRWLPTLMCAAKDKMCINTALGFDTFVVMRHGSSNQAASSSSSSPSPSSSSTSSPRLGCYFCNDVVAPVDSMRDRTLDQQCTVTRPGLAFLASAYAVELAVATLHHPLRHRAPALNEVSDELKGFGSLPHQLRGFLNRFNTTLVVGEAFQNCTACSPAILEIYRSRGHELVIDVMNQPPSFLEDLSGLTKMKKEAEKIFQDMREAELDAEDQEWADQDDPGF